MRKTAVYLDDASLRALQRLAREQEQSQAFLIREAVADYVSRHAHRPLRSLGVASGPPNLAACADGLLPAGFGE